MVFRHGRHFEGQTLQEYVLIGGTLTLVAIGGMMLVGHNLNSFFQALFDDMRNHAVAATHTSASVAAQKGAPGGKPLQTNALPPLKQDLTVSIDGKHFIVPVVAADPVVTVQTAGAAGATREYALLLEAIIAQMQEAGTLDPNGSVWMQTLANQGHKLADVESTVEQAISTGHGHEPLVYDGRQYDDARALLRTVGFANPKPGNANYDNALCASVTNTCPGQYLADFEITRKQIRDMPFMHNRQTLRVVEQIGSQIRYIANSMSMGLESNSNQPIPSQTIAEMGNKTASKMTNVKSIVICDAGDRNDTGIHCE